MEYQINLVVVHRGGLRLASSVELGTRDYCFNFFDRFPEIHVDAIENPFFDNRIHVNVSFQQRASLVTAFCLIALFVFFSTSLYLTLL